jgi:hypothetical protein
MGYPSVLARKPIITDIWKIGYLSFHYSDRKKICTSTLFFLLCFPFNIFPINNKMKLDIQCVFWKVEIKNYQNLVQFSFSPAFRQQISSMLHLFRQVLNKNRIYRPKISDFRQLSDRNSSYYGIFSIYYFLHVSKVTRTCFK